MINCFQFCFNLAFKFNLRRYDKYGRPTPKMATSLLYKLVSFQGKVRRCRLILSNPY